MNPEYSPGQPSVPQQRHKEVYSHKAPWPIYALHWSQRPGAFRLGLGSCIEEYSNKLQVVQLPAKGEPLVPVATAEHPFPPTKLMWSPAKSSGPELMATTGDHLRIWDFRDKDEMVDAPPEARRDESCSLTMKATLANIRRSGQVRFSVERRSVTELDLQVLTTPGRSPGQEGLFRPFNELRLE